MSRTIKAISIDPSKRTIEEVEIEANNLSALYKHIGCRTIDFVCRMPNGDSLIVDDEALLSEPQLPAFKFRYFLYPVHGIALIVGCSDSGRTIAPKLTSQNVRNLVKSLGDGGHPYRADHQRTVLGLIKDSWVYNLRLAALAPFFSLLFKNKPND